MSLASNRIHTVYDGLYFTEGWLFGLKKFRSAQGDYEYRFLCGNRNRAARYHAHERACATGSTTITGDANLELNGVRQHWARCPR